ncbi:MAG TPA: DEAD/DEAH box helicase family protein [Holophaga sp.]|nr:DEAD/DEAH box helicase family protein [Holophaga sp.]
MRLKDFQQECLHTLESFLKAARQEGAAAAFEAEPGRGAYVVPKDWQDIAPNLTPPYVCLRVPTGGGKTLLASHAVGRSFHSYFETDHGFVLWLVPSTAIVDQTLKALRNPRHPYRLGLQEGLGSSAVQVKSMGEALYLNRAEIEGETIVVVGTVQAWRTSAKEGRKVYEDSGQFLDFQGSLDAFEAAHGGLHRNEACRVVTSLGNLIASRRPLMILDEAHNTRTELSFKFLRALNPRCILEFTATPDREHPPSNVLHQVRAVDVKREGLIKLPVEVESASTPEDALLKTRIKLDVLQTLAKRAQDDEGRYLRPMALIQAEPDRKDAPGAWTVDKVKSHLMEHLNIAVDEIKIVTGEQKELKGVDLFQPGPVRYILTQKALAEGWDCSFAYVLCSLAVAHSVTSVEQILGRVLRMPQAKPFALPELNRAYAVVRSNAFMNTIDELRECLVSFHGFSRVEANKAVQPEGMPLLNTEVESLDYLQEPVVLPGLQLQDIPEGLRGLVRQNELGQIEAPRNALRAYACAFQKAGGASKAMASVLALETVRAERGEQIRIPWLMYEGERFSSVHLNTDPLPVETIPDSELAKLSFAPRGMIYTGLLDIDAQGCATAREAMHHEQALPLDTPTSETPEHLAWELDDELHRGAAHLDVRPRASRAFCLRVIQHFRHKGVPLAELDRSRYRLKDAVSALWDELRLKLRRAKFAGLMEVHEFSASPAQAHVFGNADYYQPLRTCEGQAFKKHLFRLIGHMNNDELAVARILDALPEVDTWVRNLDRDRNAAFWLPYPEDQAFFPDFIAQLKNGKVLVLEVKGEFLENAQSDDKRKVLELWGRTTGGVSKWISAPDQTRGPGLDLLASELSRDLA